MVCGPADSVSGALRYFPDGATGPTDRSQQLQVLTIAGFGSFLRDGPAQVGDVPALNKTNSYGTMIQFE